MIRLSVCLLAAFSLSLGCAGSGRKAAAPAPTLTRTVHLEGVGAPRWDVGVPGRLDHFAYDPATHRLFVAALENGSLEVLDLETGQRVKSIGGLQHPQGIATARSIGCAVLACEDGSVHVYDTRSLDEKKTITLGQGADNVRYDAEADAIYITYGTVEGGAIAVFNPRTWEKLREIHYKCRPESFQLDPRGTRVFANLPGGTRATQDGVVAVADRTTGKTKAEIALKGRARNFPMAFDAAHERLFVVTRRPAKLIAIDTRSNAVLTEADCAEDSDDLFYDATSDHVLVIGGGFRPDMQDVPVTTGVATSQGARRDETGAIDVFAVGEGGELTRVSVTGTAPHARTGLFVPERRALYIAVPPLEGRTPEVREYKLD